MRPRIFLIMFFTAFLISQGGDVMALNIQSQSFQDSEFMSPKYTCKGEDISPPLSWMAVPKGTKSFALICDDPDAPLMTWVHWVIYDIPADVTGLYEGIPKEDMLPDGTKQGRNDFKKIGYGGPCPPPGGPHRYYFKLYALDTMLNLEAGITKKELLRAMEGHILEEAHLIGKFKR